MLRTTVAAFGAGIGVADTVLVRPFDVATRVACRAPHRDSRDA